MELTGKVSKMQPLKGGNAGSKVELTKKSANTIISSNNDNADELLRVEKDVIALANELKNLQEGLALFKSLKPLLDQFALEMAEKKAAELAAQIKGMGK